MTSPGPFPRTLPPDDLLRALLADPDLPAALSRLGEAPRALSRLDEWMRRSYHRRPATVTGLAATVVDSMYRDGHVRESAVAAMIVHRSPATVPFVVLRCGDWVPQIRIRARHGLAALLASDPAAYLPAALPIAAYIEQRFHGEVRFALREPDTLVRHRAADAACAEAERRHDIATLRVLAGSRYTAVHVAAAIALVRLDTAIRRAALTALAALDTVPAVAFALLLDPVPSVVRTAAVVLRPYGKRLVT